MCIRDRGKEVPVGFIHVPATPGMVAESGKSMASMSLETVSYTHLDVYKRQCRDFAPSVGIPEESATGTASGATAAYLVLRCV